MNKFFYGATIGFVIAVIIHSFGLLKTIQQVLS